MTLKEIENSPEIKNYLQESGIEAETAAAMMAGPNDIYLLAACMEGESIGAYPAGILSDQQKPVVYIVESLIDALAVYQHDGAAIALTGNDYTDISFFIDQLTNKKADQGYIVCLNSNDKYQQARKRICAALTRLRVKHVTADLRCGYDSPAAAMRKDTGKFKAALISSCREYMAAHEPQADDFLTEFTNKIQTAAYNPCKTGLSFFDNLIGGGVMQQSLLLLMAAPGTGKTTLCQQIAEAMAAHKQPVIYLNLEMSREQMIAKAISSRLAKRGTPKTALEIMQGYKWTDEDKTAILGEISAYRKEIYPYLQYNPAGVNSDLDKLIGYLRDVGKKARAAGEEAPAVVVDYLHLISCSRRMDTQELIKQTVTMLKDYAKDYDTFVIGIVATNRASNKGTITMDSGRDSSNLEYTGDYVLSLNYYDLDQKNVEPDDIDAVAEMQRQKYRKMIIRVLKGRFVNPGRSANAYFNAAHNTFYGEHDFIPVPKNELSPFDEAPKTPKAGRKRGETK